ncbi:MAG: hypothetical protein LBB75_07655 [Oscillospiraceae bacterium]|jgi:pimeloyl-ACP methyl ester carboxylesterase|nr:hypothetical protein [Oscillospiraceae bacterium]
MKIKRLLALLLSLCLAAALAAPAMAVEEALEEAVVLEEEPAALTPSAAPEEAQAPEEAATPEEAPAAQAASGTCDCGEVVQVFVKGFLHPLYYNYGTDQQREAFVLGHFLMNDQGESVLDITKHWLPVDVGNHAKEPEFEFLYDYRMDPFTNARQLSEFIDYLCKETGHDKVALTGMSQGTSVVTTYLVEYGCEKLETLILISGSYQGVTVLGELLTNRLALSAPAIINLIATLGGSPLFKAFTNLLGVIFAPLETGPSGNTKLFGGKLYDWIIMKLAGQMPAIWTFLPATYYTDARKLLEGDPKYDRLLKLADDYNNNIVPKVREKLQEIRDAGVKVAVIAHYGKAPIPLVKTNYKQTDILIDTEYGSCGATVAPIGKVLSTAEINNPAYVSPDGVIDSSTCALPDQTWFIKYIGHDFVPSEALRMWIIHHDVEKDGYPGIKSNDEYPQYLRLTEDKLHTEPLAEEPAPAPANIGDAFRNLLAAMGI